MEKAVCPIFTCPASGYQNASFIPTFISNDHGKWFMSRTHTRQGFLVGRFQIMEACQVARSVKQVSGWRDLCRIVQPAIASAHPSLPYLAFW